MHPRRIAQDGLNTHRHILIDKINMQLHLWDPDSKEARGVRRFLLRDLKKVDAEWHLIATTHNLLKLLRYRRSQQQPLVMATRAVSHSTSGHRMPSSEQHRLA